VTSTFSAVKVQNWLCLGSFSPSVQFDFFLINPYSNSAYTHFSFFEIGFVLQNLVQNNRRFSAYQAIWAVLFLVSYILMC